MDNAGFRTNIVWFSDPSNQIIEDNAQADQNRDAYVNKISPPEIQHAPTPF